MPLVTTGSNGQPFFGPCTTRADGRPLRCDQAGDGNGPNNALLSLWRPKRCRRRSSVLEGSVAQVALRRHRRAGREALPWPAPVSREFRSRVRYGHSPHARCSSGANPCAFRCHLGKAFSFHVADEFVLRLSCVVLLHGAVALATDLRAVICKIVVNARYMKFRPM
jgi:hypothetical protein